MLVESLLLSVFAGTAGVALAFAGIQAIRKFAPEDDYHLHQLSLDAKVQAFALGAARLTGLIFGLAPATAAAGCARPRRRARGHRIGISRVGQDFRHAFPS